MLNLLHGELPTNTNNLNADAAKHQLFHHYLNHKVNDIPDTKIKSDKTVLECIVSSFNKEYKPETYSRKSHLNSKVSDDSLEDIRSVAHLAVWEATEKYLWGINKKIDNKKYKLGNTFQKQNTNKRPAGTFYIFVNFFGSEIGAEQIFGGIF